MLANLLPAKNKKYGIILCVGVYRRNRHTRRNKYKATDLHFNAMVAREPFVQSAHQICMAYWAVMFVRHAIHFLFVPDVYATSNAFYCATVTYALLFTGSFVTVRANQYVPDDVFYFFLVCAVAVSMAQAAYPSFEAQMNGYVTLFALLCVVLMGAVVFLKHDEYRSPIAVRLHAAKLEVDWADVGDENEKRL